MTKLEAWKAWCDLAGTPDLATEFTLEQSSHGKAFSFAWEQKQWVGLTDEEIAELHYEIKVRLMGTYKTEDIYRAIEAKLKEKNA
jgi:hypothetical protein